MKLTKKDLQIAIDGPVGSGKSTGAQLLAKRLNIFYLNTGATFRAVAYLAKKNGVNYQAKNLVELLKKNRIDIKLKKDGSCCVLLEGEDITSKLFNEEMDYGASAVAVRQDIRKVLRRKWQQMALGKPIVMEGRDINKVLPHADLKIFMTANESIRIRRLWKKYGGRKNLKEIAEQVKRRDHQDTHRRIDPLKYTPEYWFLDTSSLSVTEEIKVIIKKLKEKGLVV